jgi:hypothetical protein
MKEGFETGCCILFKLTPSMGQPPAYPALVATSRDPHQSFRDHLQY